MPSIDGLFILKQHIISRDKTRTQESVLLVLSYFPLLSSMTWLRNSILSLTFVNPFTAEQKSENKHDKTRTGNVYMLIFRFGITVVSQRRVYICVTVAIFLGPS
jgi:hypothetical protein